jgi:hypothetical protein
MNPFQPLFFSALLAIGLPALAQSTPAPQATPAKEPEPDLATLRAMKSKFFVIQHRDPASLCQALYPLQSGARAAKISWADRDGLNVISVRDFPENLATIEEAINRLDVPSAVSKAPDVELHIQVLFASKQPIAASNVPEELQEVVKSLKGALTYRGYTLVASFVQRCDGKSNRMIQGKGQIEGSALSLGTVKDPSQLRLEWEASNGLGMNQGLNAPASFLIPKFQFFVTEERSGGSSHSLAKIETSVSLKEGEHVVVGTSVIKDQGLIIVLTARRVN